MYLLHFLTEQQEVSNMALRVFDALDILKYGVISVEEIEDSGLDKDFAAALGRVLDCDKSGQIHCEGK